MGDMVQNALQENGIDFSTISMEDTFTFEDSFVPPASASATTESFIDSTPAQYTSATIEDLLNVGAAQDDDPDWMPEEELLQPSTSRARRPSCARKPAIRSVQKTSMKKKKPGRPEREGPYNIPSIPTRNARMGMSEEELQGLKYRRMRELNNQASKACRAKRKNKQQAMEEELVVEQEKNLRLRQQLENMEEKYAKLKELTKVPKN